MIETSLELRYDRRRGNFGAKNREINDAVEDFFERVKIAANTIWASSDVPVATGQLFESFEVGRIKKSRGPNGTFYTLNMGVGKIETKRPKWAGSEGEQYYAKFVQMGTKGKTIRGTNMPIRDKQRNIIKVQRRDSKGRFGSKKNLYKNEVKGQTANPYMDRFARGMGNFTRANKAALTRKIGRIIDK